MDWGRWRAAEPTQGDGSSIPAATGSSVSALPRCSMFRGKSESGAVAFSQRRFSQVSWQDGGCERGKRSSEAGACVGGPVVTAERLGSQGVGHLPACSTVIGSDKV